MNFSLVIPRANSLRFVNSQLVCLQPVGILNRERGEWDFNMILKSPFRGVIIKYLLSVVFIIITIIIIIIIIIINAAFLTPLRLI